MQDSLRRKIRFKNILSFFSLLNNSYDFYSDTKCFLFCSKCKNIPLIKPMNTTFQTAFVSCKCGKKEMTYEKISDNFLITLKEDTQLREYFLCENHEHIFQFYCENCQRNLCEECRFKHDCDIKYIKDLRNIDNNIEKKIKYIIDFYKAFPSEEPFIIKKYLFNYIKLLKNQYKLFPNYNIIENINNLFQICLKIVDEKYENELFGVLLFSLDLKGKQLNNIVFLKNRDLSKLKELNLENNKLGNNQIDVLNNLNCCDLEKLNLGINYFTNYRLLIIIAQKFLKLKELNLHSNLFNENIEILKNKNIPYNSLENLNLSNGVFSNDTIKFISSFIFKNLLYLNLSSNNLDSLSFVKKINFGKEKNTIKKLILLNNEISLENLSTEDIKRLFSDYLNLEALVLNMDYRFEYKRGLNLGFKIFDFNNNKIVRALFDQYEEKEDNNKSENLLDYRQFYENSNEKTTMN